MKKHGWEYKKVLCFAQISGLDGTARCDIMDDRVNGEYLHQPVKLFRRQASEFYRRTESCKVIGLDTLIDVSISIEIPFTCIWTLELFGRIARFTRKERNLGLAISNEWSESGRAGTERGAMSEKVWSTTSSLRRCFQ